MTSRLAEALEKHRAERDAQIAAAARTLRPRWWVVKADTGEIVFKAVLSRPLEKPGYVVVPV